MSIKIAIMGIRGIPACYGGFETLAEELSVRLVSRGHEVTVYGRSNIIYYDSEYYKGVRLVILPTISSKYFDTIAHTFVSIFHSFFKKFDVILICNSANSIFSIIPRISGKKVIVHVDGIERRRKKWNILGRMWYLLGEFLSVIFPNKAVTDVKSVQDYYKKIYHKTPIFIPNGANTKKFKSIKILKKYGLRRNDYFLYVDCLEPENNAHLLIEAFEKIETDKKLVILGDAPYGNKYIEDLKKTRDTRIIFTGAIYGNGYREFQSNACCFIHASEVSGTSLALIEAMGFGNCVIVNETPENLEVVGDCGIIYKKNNVDDLSRKINYVIDNPGVVEEYGAKAMGRIRKYYSWDYVTREYEKLFLSLLQKKRKIFI
jgi:glycosyltransferase involved in cell wall biosynthesis